MTSIGALMDKRLSLVEKTFSLCIICFLIFGFSAVAFDNLVQNGTFDNTLENWDIATTPQFTIEVVNEEAQVYGNGISIWRDTGLGFDDGEYYNLDRKNTTEFLIDGETIDSYLTLSDTITPLIINPTFDDNSSWNYSKFGNRASQISASINNETFSYDVNSTDTILSLRDSIAGVIINQTVIMPSGGFLDVEISYKHGFFNTSGEINSSMVLKTNMENYTIFNETTETNTNWTTENYSGLYLTTGTEINVTLNTVHDIPVYIGTPQITKTTKWDNCYVNITSYVDNGTYRSNIINATQNCSWSQLVTYTNFNPASVNETHTVYFRTGDVETPDGSWSNWIDAGLPDTVLDNGVYKNIYNITGFSSYSQYRIELDDSLNTTIPSRLYSTKISGVLNTNNIGSASMSQIISKPYTNYTVLKYDQEVIAEDILDCNITVTFGNYTVSTYNITGSNISSGSFEFILPETTNSTGEYELNFTVNTTFATPNATIVRMPIDVVFALDSSGSMGTEDMNNLKTATKNLVGLMHEEDRVAIFSYDGGGSEVAQPLLQEAYAYMISANKTIFNSTIDSIVSDGYTPFYDTVGEAINYTQNNKEYGRLEYVIAMTDGESNSDDYWSPEDIWGNLTTNDPNDYDSDNYMQDSGGLKGILNAPCIVYSIGLGISHDSGYPSAPNYSYIPPDPNTGIEYDVWNIANSTPYPLGSEGGKYGQNETGVDNIGRYYYTDDSANLPSIFESLYTDVYLTEVSGINSSCVVNFDNVEVLIYEQDPKLVDFYVEEITPISYEFYGTFRDLTLDELYDFEVDGVESIYIVVGGVDYLDEFNFTVENITYIGDGVFEFQYVWFYPPASINSTTFKDTTVYVTDTTGLVGTANVVFVEPTVYNVLIFIGAYILFANICLILFHYFNKSFGIDDK